MFPPWTKLEFLAAGGTSKDWASEDTPASDKAEVVDVRAAACFPSTPAFGPCQMQLRSGHR
jgi:hypothetical protein